MFICYKRHFRRKSIFPPFFNISNKLPHCYLNVLSSLQTLLQWGYWVLRNKRMTLLPIVIILAREIRRRSQLHKHLSSNQHKWGETNFWRGKHTPAGSREFEFALPRLSHSLRTAVCNRSNVPAVWLGHRAWSSGTGNPSCGELEVHTGLLSPGRAGCWWPDDLAAQPLISDQEPSAEIARAHALPLSLLAVWPLRGEPDGVASY